MTLLGQARTLDGALADEHMQFRARYKQVTNVVFDVTHRHSADWRWDPAVIRPASLDDPTAPRSYLELGPVLPQLLASLRGGTLVAENVDVMLRVAAGYDMSSGTIAEKSSYSTSYLEEAGALEVRARRTLALGVSVLTRQNEHHDLLQNQILDPMTNVPQPLPDPGALGQRGFFEVGGSVRMTTGARRFSALLEAYARFTYYTRDYCTPGNCGTENNGVPASDQRFGGRITVDAWIRDRLRLFAAYDLTSGLAFAPEITGYKSLRLMMEWRVY
jgi:hypothetical protein